MYITLNSWLGGQKMAKRKYLRRHRKKGGQVVGKRVHFSPWPDQVKWACACSILDVWRRIKNLLFWKRNIIFLSFFFYYDFDCGLFSLFFLRSLTIIITRDVCAVLSIMFVKSNFFCLCIKRPLFSLQLRCGLFSLAKLQE